MSRICAIFLILALPTAAVAQTANSANPSAASAAIPGWSGNWMVQAAPVFGSDRDVAPFPVGNEVIDDSEFRAGTNLVHTFRNGSSLTLSPGASYSPNQFDSDQPASTLSLAMRVQGPLKGLVQAPDALTWMAGYQVRADFDEAFEDYARTDQTFGLGVEFTNVLAYLCGPEQVPYVGGGCTQSGGLQYKIIPTLEWVESTDHDRERFNPKLAAEFSRPIGSLSALYAEGSIERRFYERLVAPNGDQRRDMRASVTVGVDVSKWSQQALHLPAAFSFKVGIRWVNVSSNDPAAQSDQVYIVPEMTWRQTF